MCITPRSSCVSTNTLCSVCASENILNLFGSITEVRELKLYCSVSRELVNGLLWDIFSFVAGWQQLGIPWHKRTWANLLLPYCGPTQEACHLLVSYLVIPLMFTVLWTSLNSVWWQCTVCFPDIRVSIYGYCQQQILRASHAVKCNSVCITAECVSTHWQTDLWVEFYMLW